MTRRIQGNGELGRVSAVSESSNRFGELAMEEVDVLAVADVGSVSGGVKCRSSWWEM